MDESIVQVTCINTASQEKETGTAGCRQLLRHATRGTAGLSVQEQLFPLLKLVSAWFYMDKFVVRVPHSRPEHQQEPAPKRLKQSRIEQFQKTHAPAAPLEQSVRLRAGTRHKPQKHLQQVRIEDLKKVVSQKEVLQLKEQVQSGKVEDILCAFERLESLHMTKEVLKVSPGLVRTCTVSPSFFLLQNDKLCVFVSLVFVLAFHFPLCTSFSSFFSFSVCCCSLYQLFLVVVASFSSLSGFFLSISFSCDTRSNTLKNSSSSCVCVAFVVVVFIRCVFIRLLFIFSLASFFSSFLRFSCFSLLFFALFLAHRHWFVRERSPQSHERSRERQG